MKGSCQKNSSPSTSGKQDDSLRVSPKEKLLSDQPELLQQFGLDLLPVLVQVIFCCSFYKLMFIQPPVCLTPLFSIQQIYGSSVNGTIRHKCLSVIAKLMYFSTSEMIQSLIGDTNISRYAVYALNYVSHDSDATSYIIFPI